MHLNSKSKQDWYPILTQVQNQNLSADLLYQGVNCFSWKKSTDDTVMLSYYEKPAIEHRTE